MLPEHLEIQAFGPYVEKQQIDFKAVGSKHLFLIRGETGSGKTMILDAITYALYGKSSGGQRDSLESMRSRFADDNCLTYIDFRFELHQRHYRFYRSVEMRTKRSGEVSYRIRQDAGELINEEFYPFFENPKVRALEEKAVALIGLNYEQFHQVMILPQGQFEQFLTSNSEEKQAILKTLFQMERWSSITQYITWHVHQLQEVLEQLKVQQQMLLNQGEVENRETLMQLIQDCNVQIDTKTQALAGHHHQLIELQQEVALQQQQQALQKTMQAYQLQKTKLEEQQEVMQEQRAKLELFQHLKEISPRIEQVKQQEKQHAKRLHDQQWAQQDYDKVQQEFAVIHQLQKNEAILQTQLTAIQDDMNSFQNAEEYYLRYEAEVTQYNHLCNIYEQNEKALQQVCAKKQQLATQRDTLQSDVEKRKANIADADGILEQWNRYEQATSWHKKQVSCRQGIEQITRLQQSRADQLKRSQTELARVDEEHETLYQQFLSSSALQLASTLSEDVPCPVCGSTHHPHPALSDTQIVDVVSLKKKKQKLDSLREAQQQLQQEIQTYTIQIEQQMRMEQEYMQEVEALIQEPFSMTQYTMICNKKDRYVKQQQEVEALVLEIQQIEKLYETQRSEEEKRKADMQQLMEQIHVQKALMDNNQRYQIKGIADKKALDAAIHVHKQQQVSKQSEIEQTRAKQLQLTQQYERAKQHLHQTQQEVSNSELVYKEAVSRLDEALQQHNLKKEDISSLPDKDQYDEVQQQLKHYDESCVRITTQLEEAEKQQIRITFKDIRELQETLISNQLLGKQMQDEVIVLQTQLAQYQKIAEQLANISGQLEVKQPQYLKQLQFAKALRGDNNIGIERYVLGIMLSSVTQHANTLLKLVHNGRYQLYRSNDASGRTRKFGLELEIYDAYTCTNRNVVSLSGGEKFLVSLALSLALSSVVQARDGGIRFDALFIDEGFGTLDEHSIADALQVLSSMISAKGMVGIISHVEMLKENISQGIEVMKTKKGSSIKLRMEESYV